MINMKNKTPPANLIIILHLSILMVSRHFESLFQLSKTSTQTLQILHCCLLKTSLDRHEYFFSQLVASAASASLRHARQLFDNADIAPRPLFAWNMLIKAYSKSSSAPSEAVNLFAALLRTPGALKPDLFTYPFVIKACGRCSMLGAGGSVHSLALKAGFGSQSEVRNTLLTMYGQCGVAEFARKVFDEIPERNVVSWSSMIAAYVDCNLDLEALRLFKDMVANEKPNKITCVSIVSACTNLLDIRLGKSVHSYIIINGVELHVGLETALLSMYANTGHLEEARRVFDSISERNLQSWTVMISCLANNGRGEEALYLFARMEEVGLRPDSKSFTTALSACSHRGLVSEGKQLFEKMVNLYGIEPTVEHYGCMVDLFGRAGKIDEAYQIIMSMPMEPNSVVLRSYISACKQHDSGYRVDGRLLELLMKVEPEMGANYVAADFAAYMRNEMNMKCMKKFPGYSWACY